MNKEEALNDFLKGLDISLNIATYFRGHPYLIKSVENFKQKIDILFNFLNPIRIDVTANSLFIDGRYWEEEMLYVEIARMFHLRKIESIEIKKGLTIEELIDFLNTVSLPPKEILKRGGIQNILNREKIPHFSIEGLDYSQLLRDEGEECKDIWAYVLKEAMDTKDPQKINEFADNFGVIIGKFKDKDLSEDEQLQFNINNFLGYLKDNQREKFNKCAKEMFKATLKYKDIPQDEKLDRMKALFKDLNKDDFADLLCDEILTNDSFDTLSFRLFSLLTGEENQKEIASGFLSKAANKEYLKNNPKVIKKIQDLLSPSGSQFISEVYRDTLSSLLKDIPFEKGLFFDRNLAHINYRFIILNLLAEEKNKERLNLILERVFEELEGATKDKDLQYIKCLLDVLNKRKKEEPLLIYLFDEMDNRISKFIESIVWVEAASSDLGYFVDALENTSLNADFYLYKIFHENKVNPYVLRLFFRFFPTKLTSFYKNLKKKYSDIKFLVRILESLEMLEPSLIMEILKYIFSFANEFIKIEVLRIMQVLSEFDKEFLFSVLQKGDIHLKQEALVVLARDEKAKKKAIKILFSIPNPFGIKNRIILENLMIIENIELKEASDYLSSLSRKQFFWNRNIRKKAQEILGKWNVRKD